MSHDKDRTSSDAVDLTISAEQLMAAEPLMAEARRVRQRIEGNLEALFLKQVVAAQTSDGVRLAMVRKRSDDAPRKGAVLLIHGITQNRYAWHLSRRSLVNYLAFSGYDVFNAELRGAGRSRALGSRFPDGVEDHVERDLPALVEAVREHSGEDRIFLVGHSLGGAIAYAGSGALVERLRGVITFAGAYHLGRNLKVMTEASRMVLALNKRLGPARRDAPSPARFVALAFHRYVDFFNGPLNLLPIAAWEPGSIESDLVIEWARRAFDKTSYGVMFDVMRWAVHRRFTDSTATIDYSERWRETDVPVLVVAGDRDRLNAAPDVRAAYEDARSSDRTYFELDKRHGNNHWGHVDLILGRRAPTYVWPLLLEWLSER